MFLHLNLILLLAWTGSVLVSARGPPWPPLPVLSLPSPPIPGPKQCQSPADIAFILDGSNSIWNKHFRLFYKPFFKEVVNQFNIGPNETHIAALQFGEQPQAEFTFNQNDNKEDIFEKIDAIEQMEGQSTNTHLALKVMRKKVFHPKYGARGDDIPKVCILFTDGKSTQSEDTLREATAAKKAGITIITVAIEDKINEEELKAVATAPAEENYIYIPTFEDMQKFEFQDLVATHACGDEGVKECKSNARLVFILDSSNSIHDGDFKKELGFLNDVIGRFDVTTSKVGIVSFSVDSKVVLDINQRFGSTAEMSQFISNIEPHRGTRTNTYTGLDSANDLLSSVWYDEKMDKAPQMCILLTDGDTHEPERTFASAGKLKNNNVELFVIGIGNAYMQPEQLAEMASKPTSKYLYEVNNYDGLSNIIDGLVSNVCANKP